MSNVKSFNIVNTAERLDLFMDKVNRWFIENYNIEIDYNLLNKVNTSSTEYKGVVYTTKDLIDMLTTDEKELIVKNNYIDYAIYSYVSGKELLGDN